MIHAAFLDQSHELRKRRRRTTLFGLGLGLCDLLPEHALELVD